MNVKSADCAVIVGRFQVPNLHAAHKDLIDSVVAKHPKVILFLGLAPVLGTRNNPLDFEARKKMLQEAYPQISILYIKDTPSDVIWSKKLDEQIGDIVSPNQTVVLYGSRDSFIKHYSGRYPTLELESKIFVSGTEIRNSISKAVKETADFRSGVIWGAYNRYPTVYTTVDIAIFSEDRKQLLLGRKPNETKYRFIGGFSTPESESFEDDARREVLEETSVEIGDLQYVGTYKISDWRYDNEQDKIKTIFYSSSYLFGPLKAGDDIAEIRWFDVDKLENSVIVGCHHVLLDALKAKGIIQVSQKAR